ncbi:MAG TPA: universal stress protein, partial [Pilimelia sp.]|nr:universal stress protein [Pilimelia sp.]
MSTVTGAPVVVGVDGSKSALGAVRLAAREARLRGRPLRVVHAFIWPLLNVPLGPSPAGPLDGGLRHDAELIVEEAVAEAARTEPGLALTAQIVNGAAAPVLLGESRHAALVVLGDRGLGGFTGLLVGSVAVQVVAHAECPVLVARGEPRADGPVVVGVDGSPLSGLAVGFAVEEAALRETGVVAVHAWTRPVSTGPGDMLPLVYDVDAVEAEEDRVLAESVAGWGDRYPEVPVTHRLVRGPTRATLIDESARAQLLVVGARGRGGFAGLLLGSVSQAVLHHAGCPVAVIRA